MSTGSTSLVVVGVDASRQSLIALRWAAEYARATGARLRAVAAWRYPTTYGIAPDWSKMDFEAWATQQLETSVAATLGDSPDIPVETSAVEGQHLEDQHNCTRRPGILHFSYSRPAILESVPVASESDCERPGNAGRGEEAR